MTDTPFQSPESYGDQAVESLRHFAEVIENLGPEIVGSIIATTGKDIRHGKVSQAIVDFSGVHLRLTGESVWFRQGQAAGQLSRAQAIGALIHFIDDELEGPTI